ncbi:hypothetical protein EK21DRAFT_80062 [Setomelanomma holmii]|uniref:Uncharacterized protein n=1 Tax=Setomelanomma holmii TaxID=210430 RepID=A0A9P4GVS1_9PLEO|nr:hypothetical protein EK21DRAFT_80062 [Setomelanomma holmii]
MSRNLHATVRKTFFEISQQQSIPTRLLGTLESHLIILCTVHHRQLRSDSSRARRDVRRYYKQKRAQALYMDMLDNAPHLFLPIILVATPKACEKFKARDFYGIRTDGRRIELRQDVKRTFEEIADKHGLKGSSHYNKLITILFPPSARPVTTAESGGYKYHLADIQNIRMVLGDQILDFLVGAPMLSGEARHETDCVGTCVPRNNFQDAIIELRVGQARELARVLFLASEQQNSAEIVTSNPDSVCLSGASMSAFASLFHDRIYDAIEQSQLRSWGREWSSRQVTDCVTLEIHPDEA